MGFIPKAWKNAPDQSTPIDAAALIDEETRVAAYADAAVGAATANGLGVVVHGTNASASRPVGYAVYVWIGSVDPINKVAGDIWIRAA
ncbi:MAG TPA: hypothetical protein VFF79_12800 [Conexibacter sp.]|nr:hypothetical protein [Conexibacter sp.]